MADLLVMRIVLEFAGGDRHALQLRQPIRAGLQIGVRHGCGMGKIELHDRFVLLPQQHVRGTPGAIEAGTLGFQDRVEQLVGPRGIVHEIRHQVKNARLIRVGAAAHPVIGGVAVIERVLTVGEFARFRDAENKLRGTNLDGVGDFTRATIKGGGPVPRIPALRLLGGLEAQSDGLTGRVEVEWVNGQNRVAAFETTTKGYTIVNSSINWKPFGRDKPLSLTLSANNLLDAVARRHASFLKDYAPLAGRDLRITARVSF